ncbi:hypothetical protein [Macrococcus capreoli]|uniref:hypothetical protein n=1 Tax=Macrococcus capreoli TaxID=2982690 RepID=UPI003F41DEEA
MKKFTKVLGTTTLATAVLFSTVGNVTHAAEDTKLTDLDGGLLGTPIEDATNTPSKPDVYGGINPFFDINGNNIIEPNEPYYELIKEATIAHTKRLKKQQNSLNATIKNVKQNQKSLQQQLNKLKKQESTLKNTLKKTKKIKTKKIIQAKIKQVNNQKNKIQLKLNELKKQETSLKVELNNVNQELNRIPKVK